MTLSTAWARPEHGYFKCLYCGFCIRDQETISSTRHLPAQLGLFLDAFSGFLF